MFRYYIRSLAGFNEDLVCQVIPDYKGHHIMKMFKQHSWANRPGLILSEVNQCLYPLGHVVNFGLSYKLQRTLENFDPTRVGIPSLEEVKGNPKIFSS